MLFTDAIQTLCNEGIPPPDLPSSLCFSTGAHLRVAEVAQLNQGPRAADKKCVLQFDIPVCNTLRVMSTMSEALVRGMRSYPWPVGPSDVR